MPLTHTDEERPPKCACTTTMREAAERVDAGDEMSMSVEMRQGLVEMLTGSYLHTSGSLRVSQVIGKKQALCFEIMMALLQPSHSVLSWKTINSKISVNQVHLTALL